jgi:hypothetical protein
MKDKRYGGVSQIVEHLPNHRKILSSNLHTARPKKIQDK